MAALNPKFLWDAPGWERRPSANSSASPYEQLLLRLNKRRRSALLGGHVGLDTVRQLLKALGAPDQCYRTIHIAGTNGKGSVSWKVAKAFGCAGYRTGLYTSPHLSTFRERIRINGQMIHEERVVELFDRLLQLSEELKLEPTFFELTTVAAFVYFAEEKVEMAVIETGLGGRLDATNVVTPVCTAITSIALDHTQILGTTRKQIALEKAGIVKPSVPVVLGPCAAGLGIEEVAAKIGSPCTIVRGPFADFLDENRAIAKELVSAFDLSEEGLDALPPGRFELREEGLLFDVAHNPNGLDQLFRTIAHRMPQPSLRAVVGLSQNKDLLGALATLRRHARWVHLITADHDRLASFRQLTEAAKSASLRPAAPSGPVEQVLPQLLVRRRSDELIVVCGSCFIMNAALVAAGLAGDWAHRAD